MILQQDAFDKVDAMTPMSRQKFMLELVLKVHAMEFKLEGFEEISSYFKRVINQLKQLNYSEYESDEFKKYLDEYEIIIKEKRIL